MPSRKKYDDDNDVYEDYPEEDLFSIGTDDNGDPYINPDLHNLGMDNEKSKWIDDAMPDITALFDIIIEYRNNKSSSHFFEKITFNRFLAFVARNSFAIS
tara:strand:+ start:1988 stop:2287 length:300 start_codon:yes stop_codon:yes gene_type:complete